jgi:hypothetical protein
MQAAALGITAADATAILAALCLPAAPQPRFPPPAPEVAAETEAEVEPEAEPEAVADARGMETAAVEAAAAAAAAARTADEGAAAASTLQRGWRQRGRLRPTNDVDPITQVRCSAPAWTHCRDLAAPPLIASRRSRWTAPARASAMSAVGR